MNPNRSCLPRLKGTGSVSVPLPIHAIVSAPLKHDVGGSFGVDPEWMRPAERRAAALCQVLGSRVNNPRVHQIPLSSCWEMNTKPAVLSEV